MPKRARSALQRAYKYMRRIHLQIIALLQRERERRLAGSAEAIPTCGKVDLLQISPEDRRGCRQDADSCSSWNSSENGPAVAPQAPFPSPRACLTRDDRPVHNPLRGAFPTLLDDRVVTHVRSGVS